MRVDHCRENPWVWTALGLVLVLYVFSALRFRPVSNFGNMDDALYYFGPAKALAAGEGYILPSVPFRLGAQKYPELYPLLLAGIWKVDPHFPGNILPAVGLTLTFGCLALVFAFLLLRRWPGLDDWQALAIVILCSFTIYFLYSSASIMADVPFMALMLGSFWLADFSTGRLGGPCWTALGAGLLTGLATGLRTVGVTAVAGIWCVLLVRRQYRRLFFFSAAAGPLVLLILWPTFTSLLRPANNHLEIGLGASGWAQTLCYYSNYACNWRMDMNGPGMLRAIVATNLKGVAQQPGSYLLFPLAVRSTLWSFVLVMLLSAAAYTGIVRHVQKAGWEPLTTTFPLYLLVIMFWATTPERYLLPFSPLLFGGLWLEGRHFFSLISEHLRTKHSAVERSIAGAFALGALILAFAIVVNYSYSIPARVGHVAMGNERVLASEDGAFRWIRQHTAADARIVAYHDAVTYLYTNRKSIAPIMCLKQSFYLHDSRYAEHDANHLADVARHIHASYWLVTGTDFDLDGNLDYALLQRRQEQLLAKSPIVFQSADKMVRLYDVRCLTGAMREGCSGKVTARGAESEKISPQPIQPTGH